MPSACFRVAFPIIPTKRERTGPATPGSRPPLTITRTQCPGLFPPLLLTLSQPTGANHKAEGTTAEQGLCQAACTPHCWTCLGARRHPISPPASPRDPSTSRTGTMCPFALTFALTSHSLHDPSILFGGQIKEAQEGLSQCRLNSIFTICLLESSWTVPDVPPTLLTSSARSLVMVGRGHLT